MELTKREIAAQLLTEQFAARKRIRIIDLASLAQEQGVSRRTLSRAAREMGLREIHNGPLPALWERAGS